MSEREPRYTPMPSPADLWSRWAPEDAPQDSRMWEPDESDGGHLPETWHPEDAPQDQHHQHLRSPARATDI